MIKIRSAGLNDLEDLCKVRYADRPAVHLDRIEKAARFSFIRYIAAEVDDCVSGYVLLLLQAPDDWLNPSSPFPRVIDLYVAESMRGQGIGQTLLGEAERQALKGGYPTLYLSVDTISNPRAHQLYLRLGYLPMQENPVRKDQVIDADGTVRSVDQWLIDMRKPLL